jgi:integrase
MAWIEKKPSGFLVRWREGTRVLSESRPSMKEARERKAELELEQARGSYVARDARRTPLEDYAQEIFAAATGLRASTLYSYRTLWSKWVQPRLGQVPIGELDARRVRSAFGDMAAAGAPVLKVKAILSKVVRQALAEGLLPRNPLLGLQLPKQERREVRILTPEEVSAVADAIRERYRCAVYLAAWGTLRIGEIGALKLEDLDFDNGTVTVRRGVSTGGGETRVEGPKTKASRRTVALPGWLMTRLKAHAAWFGDPEGWLFRSEGGDLIHHQTMWPIWKEACEAAGLQPRPRFHDLRHTAVALMIQAGAHPKVIQARCGHSTMAMTMDTYGHLFPGTDAELVAALERYAQ